MKSIFIINPCAGQGKGLDKLEADINEASFKTRIPVEIYHTKAVGDAERFAREVAEKGEEVRLFACGGDGTLNEVANGAFGYDNVEIGVLPIGTGNDYIRNYGTSNQFMNIEKQLLGEASKFDLIKYTGIMDGKKQVRYCANMINIGFDCNVVDKTAEMKKKPLISGSMAYLLSVLAILIKKKGANLRVEVDDRLVHKGPNLLCAIANGSYCGGGVYSSPQAKTDDGLMDVNVVLDMSRVKFLKLFPSYKKGTHFQVKGIEKMVQAYPCQRATIEPLDGEMRVCADGEICTAERITLEVVSKAINFVRPKE